MGVLTYLRSFLWPRRKDVPSGKSVKDSVGVSTHSPDSSVFTKEKKTIDISPLEKFHRLDKLLLILDSSDDFGLDNLEKLRQEVFRRIEAIRKSL